MLLLLKILICDKMNWIGATIKKKREKDYGVQTRAVL